MRFDTAAQYRYWIAPTTPPPDLNRTLVLIVRHGQNSAIPALGVYDRDKNTWHLHGLESSEYTVLAWLPQPSTKLPIKPLSAEVA